jgi:hypothetical protein
MTKSQGAGKLGKGYRCDMSRRVYVISAIAILAIVIAICAMLGRGWPWMMVGVVVAAIIALWPN